MYKFVLGKPIVELASIKVIAIKKSDRFGTSKMYSKWPWRKWPIACTKQTWVGFYA